ncbi:hypothetical protein Sjap_021699 [Stephania japonica]|uniref:Uncharacterized protein n=1 Tax=Stephania japonica TaxID=461633 RepID=A0AAP0EQL5_9MAGN
MVPCTNDDIKSVWRRSARRCHHDTIISEIVHILSAPFDLSFLICLGLKM